MTGKQATPQQSVDLRCYEELNDFLPEHLRRKSFRHHFNGRPTITELLSSVGVPHAAIDLVLVNDEPVAFSHQVSGGERIAVFPVFERFDISPLNRLRPKPLRRTCFVAEASLGKLARLLRLAGFDTIHSDSASDIDIVTVSSEDKRVILSCDPALLKHGRVTHGYWVRESDPPAQFREIIDAFDLRRTIQPFSRCMECNGELRVAEDSDVLDSIPFAVLVAFDDFWQCEQCQEIYWKGSHYERLAQLIETI